MTGILNNVSIAFKMSIKADLFTAIQSRLMTKLNFADTLPSLKWVDKNKGQLQSWSNFGAIPLPAVLISFPDVAWQPQGNNNQSGLCKIKLVLLYEVYSEFYQDSPDQEDALKCFEYDEQLFAAVQGFAIDKVTPLNRVRTTEEEDHDAVVVFTQEYECMITDTGANTFKNYTLVEPDLVVEYKKNLEKRPPKVNIQTGFITD